MCAGKPEGRIACPLGRSAGAWRSALAQLAGGRHAGLRAGRTGAGTVSAARPPEGAHAAAEGEGCPASAARPPEGAPASAHACRSVAWLALPGAGYLMLVFALPLAVLLASS